MEPVEDPDLSGDGTSKEYKKNWARLIQKIYEVDPLSCPKCHGRMPIISFIENEEVIKKILKHLDLWKISPPELWRVKARPPPKANRPQPNVHYRLLSRPGATQLNFAD